MRFRGTPINKHKKNKTTENTEKNNENTLNNDIGNTEGITGKQPRRRANEPRKQKVKSKRTARKNESSESKAGE